VKPLKKIAGVFILLAVIGSLVSVQIMRLFQSFLPKNVLLISYTPMDTFVAIATIIIGFAAIFTIPIALIELVKYIKPALYKKEKGLLNKLLPTSMILFAGGSIFGVYAMASFGLKFFANISTVYGIQNLWSLSGLTESIALTAIAFGITFQLPIFLTFLVRQGIINLEQLSTQRATALIGFLVISAVITPPDIISQLLMTVPLYLLFEGTLLYLRFTYKQPTEVII